jgi:hypothetical protein
MVPPLSSLLPSHYTDNASLTLSCTLSMIKLTIIKMYRKYMTFVFGQEKNFSLLCPLHKANLNRLKIKQALKTHTFL